MTARAFKPTDTATFGTHFRLARGQIFGKGRSRTCLWSAKMTHMDAIKFFDSEALRLPLERTANEDDFEQYLRQVFDRYLAAFDLLQSPDSLTQGIKERRQKAERLCADVQTAVREYLAGSPHAAFEVIDKALASKELRDLIGNLRTDNVERSSPLQEMYRIRATDEPTIFRRKDIFHVPFELRHRVPRQRYSIPGLPCLYLGATLFVCWDELRRLPFHKLYAARFKAADGANISVLDFSRRPRDTARFVDQVNHNFGGDFTLHGPFFLSRAICWPLLAACSVRRLHHDAPFIAEYIVPQLVLEWIARPNADGNRLDGIAYFSVRTDPEYPDLCDPFVNLVFPVQRPLARGYCPVLREKFELSEPGAWQLLESAEGLARHKSTHRDAQVYLVPDFRSCYGNSGFGLVESRLAGLPTARLVVPST
jgi:hypothetical protein